MRAPRAAAVFGILVALAMGGCASLPPGSDYPKHTSVALAHPEATHLGHLFEVAGHDHPGNSAFRILSVGADGFAVRMQMIAAAENTLDLQYFIFRGDNTGRLLTDALLVAADRGVHLRLLVDDGDTIHGDEQLVVLAAHPQVEIRVFNPFAYRGHQSWLRSLEFTLNPARLDYRMHNKLLVADNAAALIGGRNIGDAYFQVDAESQFADDDVFVAGPVVQALSATFDEYWNSALAIPVEALAGGKPAQSALDHERAQLAEELKHAQSDRVSYVLHADEGDPLAGILVGRLPLVWAGAQVVCDSPEKKRVANGSMVGRLMYEPVAAAAAGVQSELLIITPYFVPTKPELQLLHTLRQRNVRVRILTNSLESTNSLTAYAAYARFRLPLLRDGVELYEVRALLGKTSKGSGQTAAMSRHGNYGLHAKLFVFDQKSMFVGSMNFDQRSAHLNTEVGLIIASPELSRQTAARFEAMTQPASAYAVALVLDQGGKEHLHWRTQEGDQAVDYTSEPSTSAWRRSQADLLTLLPIDSEL